jgi:hypothetical protein
MMIERFKDTPAVYRRFRERGRMTPEGLLYLSSWGRHRIQKLLSANGNV